MSALSRALPVLLLIVGSPLASGLTCSPGDEIVWVRFNGDDVLEVPIAPDGDGAPLSLDLMSSGGVSVVGVATVDPGASPANTLHLVSVRVDDDYRRVVQRVALVVTSDGRARDEFELSQDSADVGYWWIELQSFGAIDARRVDTFAFELYRPDSVFAPPDTSDTSDTGDTGDTSDDTSREAAWGEG